MADKRPSDAKLLRLGKAYYAYCKAEERYEGWDLPHPDDGRGVDRAIARLEAACWVCGADDPHFPPAAPVAEEKR